MVQDNESKQTRLLIFIPFIHFSGLIAFGKIGWKWNMVHRTSAARNALTKNLPAGGWQGPLAAGPGAGEKKWEM
jgi:hypothetical protein